MSQRQSGSARQSGGGSQRASGAPAGSQRASAAQQAAQDGDADQDYAGEPQDGDAPEEDLEQGPADAEEGGASMEGEMAAEGEGEEGDNTMLFAGIGGLVCLLLCGVAIGVFLCIDPLNWLAGAALSSCAGLTKEPKTHTTCRNEATTHLNVVADDQKSIVQACITAVDEIGAGEDETKIQAAKDACAAAAKVPAAADPQVSAGEVEA